MLARTSAIVLLAGLIGVGLMRPGVSSAEPTVSQFLLAWESGHYQEAAELTTGNRNVVATELEDAYNRLDASNLELTMSGVSQQGKTAYAKFNAAVDLGGSGLTWKYDNGFSLADGPHGWRVAWSPSVIVAGMTNREQLAVVSSWKPRAQLLDSAGKSLNVWSPVYKVGVTPGQLTDPERTAAGLAQVTQLSAEQIEGQMDQGLSDLFLPLLTLSPSEYASMATRLKAIPGLQIQRTTERLFDSIAPDVVGSVGTETAKVLLINGVQYRPGNTIGLSGLQQTYQRQLTGIPRTDVVLQQSGQSAVDLKTWAGSVGMPVRTTLDSGVQSAANQALDHLPSSAAVVAVQSGSGKILAVASHTARGMPSLSPLAGGYQPGQAFTIVSSAAILSAGQLRLGGPVPCLSSFTVGGQQFRNNPPQTDSGASFRSDFAHACSTAFAGGLAVFLHADDLMKSSEEFGIGGWQLPLTAFAGTIGHPSGEGLLASDMIGAGDVRVSPLGMALAASVVDSGSWHAPTLVTSPTDPADPTATTPAPRGAPSPRVLADLRELMRDAAGTGSNAVADASGDVYAQAGSAPYGSANLWLNWFVGYRGKVAFAVVEVSKSAPSPAAPLAARFLQNLPAGS